LANPVLIQSAIVDQSSLGNTIKTIYNIKVDFQGADYVINRINSYNEFESENTGHSLNKNGMVESIFLLTTNCNWFGTCEEETNVLLSYSYSIQATSPLTILSIVGGIKSFEMKDNGQINPDCEIIIEVTITEFQRTLTTTSTSTSTTESTSSTTNTNPINNPSTFNTNLLSYIVLGIGIGIVLLRIKKNGGNI
jgi:hypothetical protein